ncbi:MAG: non-heme Fe2+,alpha-ketoglutarate-dependent halogenase [Porticoccaceae bacterium]|jgi:non-heme Fe2+,alpha-ketoglutarate-dependent halogenase
MSKFRAVPDQTDLEKMDRDLSFYPSRVTQPETLSCKQVEQYNRDGYVKDLTVFSQTEADELRGYFDRLLERAIAAGGDSYSISSAHLTYGRVYDLLSEPRIVAFVKDILGEDVIGWGSHFFCKMPHDGMSVAWHQDASYWPLTPSKAVTVWLAIDDADVENACMKFVAGSQHVGHLTFRPSADDEGNVLNQTIEDAEQYGEVVYDELAAGQVSLHADLLLHGSEANESDRRRCGLTLRYCTPDVVAGSNWHDKGVVVAGRDHSGNWTNPARPADD